VPLFGVYNHVVVLAQDFQQLPRPVIEKGPADTGTEGEGTGIAVFGKNVYDCLWKTFSQGVDSRHQQYGIADTTRADDKD
jgi:hypothetical protein